MTQQLIAAAQNVVDDIEKVSYVSEGARKDLKEGMECP